MSARVRWFVFVRHAVYDYLPGGKEANDKQPLTPEGVAQAEAAGDFLKDVFARHGLRVGRVVATRTRRAAQTAEVIRERLGSGAATVERATLGREADERMMAWTDGLADGEAVLCVGHGKGLGAVRKVSGLPRDALSRSHGAVVVCRSDHRPWKAVEHFPS